MKPIEYDLYLNPDMEKGTYSGNETITLKFFGETNEIVLHSHRLTVTQVKFLVEAKEIPVSEHNLTIVIKQKEN